MKVARGRVVRIAGRTALARDWRYIVVDCGMFGMRGSLVFVFVLEGWWRVVIGGEVILRARKLQAVDWLTLMAALYVCE